MRIQCDIVLRGPLANPGIGKSSEARLRDRIRLIMPHFHIFIYLFQFSDCGEKKYSVSNCTKNMSTYMHERCICTTEKHTRCDFWEEV